MVDARLMIDQHIHGSYVVGIWVICDGSGFLTVQEFVAHDGFQAAGERQKRQSPRDRRELRHLGH